MELLRSRPYAARSGIAAWSSSTGLRCLFPYRAGRARPSSLPGIAGAGGRGLLARCGSPCRVLAAHCGGTLPASFCADMGFAFRLLLGGFAFRFLTLRLGETLAVLFRAFVFGGTGLLQCDGDCLPAALYLAAFSFRTAFEFAMLIFVHDPANCLALSG